MMGNLARLHKVELPLQKSLLPKRRLKIMRIIILRIAHELTKRKGESVSISVKLTVIKPVTTPSTVQSHQNGYISEIPLKGQYARTIALKNTSDTTPHQLSASLSPLSSVSLKIKQEHVKTVTPIALL